MPLAFITLFTGLAISAVAIYYSVLGLAAIFAAAVLPIIVMGTILECAKLVTAWWLKSNWQRAPISLKSYLTVSVIVLMLITSMGIFGYLSKAHSDQAVPTGDTAAKAQILDEKIKYQRDIISGNQNLIKQMDEVVNQTLARTDDAKGSERALAVRRSQAKERQRLVEGIDVAQAQIAKLNEEKAPIAASLRKIEAEVGPIKYIATLIYGDNPDQNVLEKAVTWVIILIVLVFDPLAVLLLLASQMSFQWAKEEKKDGDIINQHSESLIAEPRDDTTDRTIQTDSDQEHGDQRSQRDNLSLRPEREIVVQPVEDHRPDSIEQVDSNDLVEESQQEFEQDSDDEMLEIAPPNEKVAMHRWKSENPDKSLKSQRRLLMRGRIKELPWTKYLEAQPDDVDSDAKEAAKWAIEQLEKSEDTKKKDSDLDRNAQRQTDQEKQNDLKNYIQNAEQTESTLWQRVQAARK